ncbi:MAG: UvrB/UvrC motif-containing protein [Clostridia bacterium]|nr:UvrB/UvrC motif-containing protein [Clostridia bacterium]
MKRCDNCQNEATHYFRITVNGRTKEVCLCSECARRREQEEGEFLFGADDILFSPMFTRAKPQKPASEESQSVTLPSEETRSLATLKAQLKRALRREDYLTAARVRDSIRALEGK